MKDDVFHHIEGIMRGLVTIDETVRASFPGEPGSGVFLLLQNGAAHLGLNRPSFPSEPLAPITLAPAEAETDK